jgi:Secretion system C-terminal sorting domain
MRYKIIGLLWVSLCVKLIAQTDPPYANLPATAQNVVQAEYFFDADPEFGNGTPIALSAAQNLPALAASLDISALSNGIHRLYVRTRNAAGEWSFTQAHIFLKDFNAAYPSVSAAQNLVKAEYFFDADPGFGNGTAAVPTGDDNFANFVVATNTSNLSRGIHRLYVRVLNQEGAWSVSNSRSILVDADEAYPNASAPLGNITRVEYFLNNDPGFGNGIPLSITPSPSLPNLSFNADLSALGVGNHTLFVRSLDDWSVTYAHAFTKNSVALPLELLSFQAKYSEGKVTLNWQTVQEQNVANFEIHRSQNGRFWENIGNVKPNNQLILSHYSFMDNSPLQGISYYKLKLVDENKSYAWSKVENVINIDNNSKIEIFPNPIVNELVVNLSEPSNVQFQIFNALGTLLMDKRLSQAQETIDMTHLPSGVYVIRFSGGTSFFTKKITKL